MMIKCNSCIYNQFCDKITELADLQNQIASLNYNKNIFNINVECANYSLNLFSTDEDNNCFVGVEKQSCKQVNKYIEENNVQNFN